RVVACGPLAHAVERLARDDQVPKEQEQSGGRGGEGPPILAREVLAEGFFETKPSDEAAEDRQGAGAAGFGGLPLGVCPSSWPSDLVRIVHGSRSRETLQRRMSRPSPGLRGPRSPVARRQRSPPT